jgi:ADP-ribose pyrophosphatase
MESKLKRIDRKLAYKGEVVDLYKDTMEYPDGSCHEWDFVHHKRPNGALILPVLPDGRILTISQYRPASDSIMLELPAGSKEPFDRDTCETAGRELVEETGYVSGDIRFLMRIYLAVAYDDEWLDIYVAYNCHKDESGQLLDSGEDIKTDIYTLSDLLSKIKNGELMDGPAVAAITAYAAGLIEE